MGARVGDGEGELTHGCHALGHASPIEAIQRTGGVRQSREGGMPFWAGSDPNWSMGLK